MARSCGESRGDAANRLVEEFSPIILRDVYQSCVSAPQYNNASAVSGGPPTCLLSIPPLLQYFHARSAETSADPLSQRRTLLGDAIFDIERCDYRRTGVSGYAARARSRSKSLSRRRSFSITAWRNYKGARNCSPGAHRSPRKSRNAPPATCAPP